ncbi:hypothetical protein K435DRAFT_365285 [Dendrothele bispora CBS 962.96]|uniref:EF-hand domain-containing protein n=1 Tax=Dendrothele bispora (strain CBS 962.96) TaxID=1314807 RepID=A0A4S8LCS3_DENBC|nr:hypothetical protein K435DRAFT_365285 [Dendrothele bispora CBS 962.96]
MSTRLVDDEGSITDELEKCLRVIFAKYCTPKSTDGSLADNAHLTTEGLDAWAKDTNGSPFSQETKDEILEFMDVTDDGHLTFKGFLQVYQLQTENDPEETYSDLVRLVTIDVLGYLFGFSVVTAWV